MKKRGLSVDLPVKHIGSTQALCDGRKRANLREDLGVERYRQLGVVERFRGEKPYRICPRCIARAADTEFMTERWHARRKQK